MTLSAPFAARAPGVYHAPPGDRRSLEGVRMDVAGFVGVAPRGPAREPSTQSPWSPPGGGDGSEPRRTVPVVVESWDEYRTLFGGFEGPGQLPYAVHAFFRQGGRRAWVARIVRAYGDERDAGGVAQGPLPGLRVDGLEGLPVVAAEAGEAGNEIEVDLAWDRTSLTLDGAVGAVLHLTPAGSVHPGDLLRVESGSGAVALLSALGVRREERSGGATDRVVLAEDPEGTPASVERVRATLRITGEGGVEEVHAGLGLSPDHPRWVGAVLTDESTLLRGDGRWDADLLLPSDPDLADPPAGGLAGGRSGVRASGRIPGLASVRDGTWLEARSEGLWGRRLRASVRFPLRPLEARRRDDQELGVHPETILPRGSVLRVTDDLGVRTLHRVLRLREEWSPDDLRELVAELDDALPASWDTLEVVELEMEVEESADASAPSSGIRRSERHTGLGLHPDHPRWAHRELLRSSRLVRPHGEWRTRALLPTDLELRPRAQAPGAFLGGEDRWEDIVHEDFFDPLWTPAEPASSEGVHALARIEDLSLLCVPDLYAPGPLPEVAPEPDPGPMVEARFVPCVPPAVPPRPEVAHPTLPGLHLDPALPAHREAIVALQSRLTRLAGNLGRWIALLDVPPGLDDDEVLRWRGRFDTAFAAAYHPWPSVVVAEDGRDEPVRVPPSGAAAGIIASTEAVHGLAHGPARESVVGAVRVADDLSPLRHDRLHPQGINVLMRERVGIRIGGARTLSRDPALRQLSVRRLLSWVARTLEREMQWLGFEPNGPALRSRVRHLLTVFLRGLHRQGAFRGASEDEAFFVRCDDALNPARVVEAGRLVAEIGLAAAEPLEFIVLRLERGGSGGLRVEG